MIDLDRIKKDADLLAICGSDTNLKRVASTGGGEYAGPCPWCGGRDRFRVQPGVGRWLCRSCTDGKWRDVIDYIQRRDRCDFKAALQSLTGGNTPTTTLWPQHKPQPAYQAPDADWQQAGLQALEVCEGNLWSNVGQRALTWLHNRGLTDATVRRYRLGYSPGAELSGLYIPHGVVIPCLVAGQLWYLKIRTNKNEPGEKYKTRRYSKTAAIYGADDLRGASMALFCEGEFDTMLANQEIGDVIPCVTFGSAQNMPDLATWGMYLLPITSALLAYDTDRAGQEGANKVLELLGERAKLALLPDGDWKDITEFHQAGGDLWLWIRNHIEFYTDLPTGGAVDLVAALGGVVEAAT